MIGADSVMRRKVLRKLAQTALPMVIGGILGRV